MQPDYWPEKMASREVQDKKYQAQLNIKRSYMAASGE
jgi:hypothetical protein